VLGRGPALLRPNARRSTSGTLRGQELNCQAVLDPGRREKLAPAHRSGPWLSRDSRIRRFAAGVDRRRRCGRRTLDSTALLSGRRCKMAINEPAVQRLELPIGLRLSSAGVRGPHRSCQNVDSRDTRRRADLADDPDDSHPLMARCRSSRQYASSSRGICDRPVT